MDIVWKGIEYPQMWLHVCPGVRDVYEQRDRKKPIPEFELDPNTNDLRPAANIVDLLGIQFPYIGQDIAILSGDTLGGEVLHSKDSVTGARVLVSYDPSESASEVFEESIEVGAALEIEEEPDEIEGLERLVIFEPGLTVADLMMEGLTASSSGLHCVESSYQRDVRLSRILMLRLTVKDYEHLDFLEVGDYRGYATLEEFYGSTPDAPAKNIEIRLFNDAHHYSIYYVLPTKALDLQEQVVRAIVAARTSQ